ncbi:ATP-binding protein [Hyphomicrobium sp.]|uniref:ATP-binding protein n=1 Tax=Hyphomicrobium sp. TaxID=82 RepID=UPI001D38C4C3|nr:ATP-binding protein [Hyphomicrobium sp.]MBY0561489.1 ATP-binding protein [Hyphomicrobium sp.]
MTLGNGTAALVEQAKKDVLNGRNKIAKSKVGIPKKALNEDGTINWQHLEPEIVRQGKQIILPGDPADMPIDDAINALIARKAEEEEMMAVQEVIDAYPLDGAVAFMMAMKTIYGWASPVPEMTWFGPIPPRMITVDVGPKPEDKIQIPWGQFKVPGIENPIKTIQINTNKGPAFAVIGELRKKESHVLKELADLARDIAAEHSIYRGRAIRLATDDNGMLNVEIPPTFIDVEHVNPDNLIMSEVTGRLIDVNVFTLLRKTQQCVKAGIPLKRGVLLWGKYGTGKTLTSLVTAKYGTDNAWTFITLDKPQSLKQALEFAKRYEPCVVFAEDIDRITGTRDEPANDLLNTLDGILSKNSKTMVVLTTNEIETIHPAMLRPGRLDAVIEVTPPDAKAAERLVRLYSHGLLAINEDLSELGNVMSGWTAAVIREAVERAKLAMISRGGDELLESDLIAAALTMDGHRKLLEGPAEKEPTAAEAVGTALQKMIKEALAGGIEIDDVKELVEEEAQATRDTVHSRANETNDKVVGIGGMAREISDRTKKIVNQTEPTMRNVRRIAEDRDLEID